MFIHNPSCGGAAPGEQSVGCALTKNSYVGSFAMDGRTTPFGKISPAPRWRMLLSLLVLLSGCTSFKTYCKNGFKVGPNYGRPQVDVANDWIDKSKLLRRQA